MSWPHHSNDLRTRCHPCELCSDYVTLDCSFSTPRTTFCKQLCGRCGRQGPCRHAASQSKRKIKSIVMTVHHDPVWPFCRQFCRNLSKTIQFRNIYTGYLHSHCKWQQVSQFWGSCPSIGINSLLYACSHPNHCKSIGNLFFECLFSLSRQFRARTRESRDLRQRLFKADHWYSWVYHGVGVVHGNGNRKDLKMFDVWSWVLSRWKLALKCLQANIEILRYSLLENEDQTLRQSWIGILQPMSSSCTGSLSGSRPWGPLCHGDTKETATIFACGGLEECNLASIYMHSSIPKGLKDAEGCWRCFMIL